MGLLALALCLSSYALTHKTRFDENIEYESMKDFFKSWDSKMKDEKDESKAYEYVKMKNAEMIKYLMKKYPKIQAEKLDANDLDLVFFGSLIMLAEENEYQPITEANAPRSTIRCLIELVIGYIGIKEAYDGIIKLFSGELTAMEGLAFLKPFIKTKLGILSAIFFVADFFQNCV